MTAPTIFRDLVQGSGEWLDARCGILTASQIGKLITPTMKVADNETSRTLTLTLAAERISGHVEYVHPSFDMQRGTDDEPYAREMYEATHGPVEQIGFATYDFDGNTLGASPDGLIGTDGGIEIKSRAPKAQLKTILTDEVSTEYLPQIQTCLLVTGRQWWDFVSYAQGWPLYVKRVIADPIMHTVILDALNKFEADVEQIITTHEHLTAGMPIAPRIEHSDDMWFTF